MSSSGTDTMIDIQDTFDEDGEIENGRDGGHTIYDGGCREEAAAKSLKEPPAPPPNIWALTTTLQVQTAAPNNQQMPCKATNPHYLWNNPPISDPSQEPPTNQWGQYQRRHCYSHCKWSWHAALTISGQP